MAQPVGYPATVDEARQVIKDFGTCLDFRAGGKLTLGTTNPFSSNFYFSAWVKWYGDNGTFQHIFAKRDSYGASTMMFDLYLNTGTNLVSLDTNVAQKAFAYLLPKFKWVHICWVHNVTDSLDQLYIDGDRYANLAIAELGTGTTALNSIGSVETGATEPFNGLIDEIVIGQEAPTWAQVLAIRNKYSYLSKWTELKLDEGSGTTATDSSGNGNTGTITTATYKTDKIMTTRTAVTNRFSVSTSSQKSLFLNGTSSFATIPIVPDVTGFCLSVWYYSRLSTTNQRIISWMDSGSVDGFEIVGTTPVTKLQFTGRNGSTQEINIAYTAGHSLNMWNFLTITFIPNSAKFYKNTSQIGSTDTSCAITLADSPFTIGKSANASSNFFGGFLKNFTFQNTTTPWTQAQIDNLYWRNIVPSGALQWTMNDVATDQNGENALTLTGTSYSTNVPPHFGTRSTV